MKYLILMMFIALPATANADWMQNGVHPVAGPIHMNAAPQFRAEPPQRVQPVFHFTQPVHHDQNDRRPRVDEHRSFYHNDGFYSGFNDGYPYVTVSPTIALPDDLETIIVNGQTFFYSDGIFYQEIADQLTVIPPVLGAVVEDIPTDYQVVMVDGINYFYAEGVFYQRLEQGFQVVQSPVSDQE